MSEAAQALGMSRARIREAVQRGEVSAYQPGARTKLVFLSDLRRWIESKQVKAR